MISPCRFSPISLSRPAFASTASVTPSVDSIDRTARSTVGGIAPSLALRIDRGEPTFLDQERFETEDLSVCALRISMEPRARIRRDQKEQTR
jgi:hypothetical protein